MSIQTKVDNIIKTLGSINIQDFIELSNFDDEGFYNLKNVSKISKNGHFITSPEITPLFGYSLCNQFLQAFKNISKVHLLELGPGNGTLLHDIYKYLSNQNIEITQISILEKSKYFKRKIKDKNLFEINFLNDLSDLKVNSDEILFVYSNEFFDAISSKQYVFENKDFNEIKITKIDNSYTLINESSLLSKFLKDYYSEYDFQNGDILEHSNYLVSLLQDLKSILKNKFFFTATDYGYDKLPKKSTLRLISRHQPVALFDKFDDVDYSFGVNFELIMKTFEKFDPVIISQENLIKTFLPKNFHNNDDTESLKAIEIISGKSFSNMGRLFKNISFYLK